jgi:hypothetical protein
MNSTERQSDFTTQWKNTVLGGGGKDLFWDARETAGEGSVAQRRALAAFIVMKALISARPA